MKTKQKNKELEKIKEELLKLNELALYNLAINCHKKALEAMEKIKKDTIIHW